jgi:uncharacterized iron-regulated membrane protein
LYRHRIEFGVWLMGLIAIARVFDCLVALWLSFPSAAAWPRSLAFRWRAGGHRLTLDLHRSGGCSCPARSAYGASASFSQASAMVTAGSAIPGSTSIHAPVSRRGAQVPGAGSAGDIVMQAMFPLHSGRIIGIAGRILMSLMGVAVATLSVTGVLIWMRKRRAAMTAAGRIAGRPGCRDKFP